MSCSQGMKPLLCLGMEINFFFLDALQLHFSIYSRIIQGLDPARSVQGNIFNG